MRIKQLNNWEVMAGKYWFFWHLSSSLILSSYFDQIDNAEDNNKNEYQVNLTVSYDFDGMNGGKCLPRIWYPLKERREM